MDQGDEFLVSSKSNKMLYPIAIIDEETFNVADYLALTVSPSSNGLVLSHSGV